MNLRPSLLLLLALAANGCAYVRDRGADAAQILDLAGGVSEGFDVNVRATKLLQVGVGGYHGLWWGGLKEGVIDTWQEERAEVGIGPLYMHEYFRSDGDRLLDVRTPLFGDAGFREYPLDVTHLTDRGWAEVGVTLNLAILGLGVGLDLGELVDFLGGIATFDLYQDDAHATDTETLLQRLSGDDARLRANAARALRRRFGRDFGYVISTSREAMPLSQVQAIHRWRAFIDQEIAPRLEEPPAAPPAQD